MYDHRKILTSLALADCKHDFGKNIELPDTTYLGITRGECKGTINIYNGFVGAFSEIIPYLEEEDAQTEEEILDSVTEKKGFYESIKNSIINGELISPVCFDRKTYNITYYPTKIKEEHGSIPRSFRETSGKNTFIVLYDASFFYWKGLIEYSDPNESYTFYIIINNEQLADSANESDIENISGRENITIYYLYSNEEKIYDTTTNLHTKYDYTLMNNNDRIDTIYKNNSYENLKHISNKNSASLLSCQKQDPNYLFFKRAGDWCQALSLLDEGRVYKKYSIGKQYLENTTIQSLKHSAEVALITHDKVLLAYSLFLGINVFYSIPFDSNNTVYNIFFKNTTTISILQGLRSPTNPKRSTHSKLNATAYLSRKGPVANEQPYVNERALKRQKPKSGGSLKSPAKEKITTAYVNDDFANFYTVTPDNIYITKKDLTSLRKELVEVPVLDSEIYYSYRFLFYYLDEIYTRIFLLAGEHETYQDDLHFVYLKILAELFNIFDNILVKNQSGGQLNVFSSSHENIPMLPSNYKEINLNGPITLENIKKIEDIYVEHRNIWTFEYLKNFEHVLKGNLFEMDIQLSEFHKKLHDFVMANYRKDIIKTSGGSKKTRKTKKCSTKKNRSTKVKR